MKNSYLFHKFLTTAQTVLAPYTLSSQDQVDSLLLLPSSFESWGVSSDESPEQCLSMNILLDARQYIPAKSAPSRRRHQSVDADYTSAVTVVVISLLAPPLKYQK